MRIFLASPHTITRFKEGGNFAYKLFGGMNEDISRRTELSSLDNFGGVIDANLFSRGSIGKS